MEFWKSTKSREQKIFLRWALPACNVFPSKKYYSPICRVAGQVVFAGFYFSGKRIIRLGIATKKLEHQHILPLQDANYANSAHCFSVTVFSVCAWVSRTVAEFVTRIRRHGGTPCRANYFPTQLGTLVQLARLYGGQR
jgi:hypothetical protein